MKILITGALGHIGSGLIRELVKIGGYEKIILVDNFLTQRYCSLFNLNRIKNRIYFIQADISQADNIKLIEPNVDIVIHLAAITDAAGSFERAQELKDNNLNSTLNIAEYCIENDSRLIFLSSTSVYGSQENLVSEDCSLEELKPQSPYAEMKLEEEFCLSRLARDKNLKVSICRFGTIFGVSSGMRFHTAVNKFCYQAALGQPITVWKTAMNQKRPYLGIVDASRAIMHIANKNLFNGEVYNILSGNYTVGQIINYIRECVDDVRIDFVDNKIMNQLSYEVSDAKFRLTGYESKDNIELDIKETIMLLT